MKDKYMAEYGAHSATKCLKCDSELIPYYNIELRRTSFQCPKCETKDYVKSEADNIEVNYDV